jgi:organic hydroperoxide reductase OsmC/OhrA
MKTARPSGSLIEGPESGGHFESVLLRPKVTIESGAVQEALHLHQEAHQACFIANSVNFPVRLEPAIQVASNE